jgi:hypothetical protein
LVDEAQTLDTLLWDLRKPAPIWDPPKSYQLNICGGCQGMYGDLKIGAGNIRTGEYVVDGVKETGRVATLWLYVRDRSDQNKTITVYIGQTFTIDKYKVTVEDIKSGRGSVSLRIRENSI